MTPLANYIAKELALPSRRRTFVDNAGLVSHFKKVFKTFEMSDFAERAWNIQYEMAQDGLPSIETSFLPSERTWFEWDEDGLDRMGVMLRRNGKFADIIVASEEGSAIFGQIALRDQLLNVIADKKAEILRMTSPPLFDLDVATAFIWRLYSYLVIVNERATAA